MKTITSEYEQQALDFLNATNTTLDITFKEFNSMPWDEDKQKRNIFSCTLSNSNHSYAFDFGSSVAASCGKEPKLNLLRESDKITVYAGLKSANNQHIQSGINITLTKAQLLNTDYELLTQYIDELEKKINSTASDKNKKAYDLFENGKISRDERDKRLIIAVNRGIIIQTIQNAIKRKIIELSEETEYSRDLQSDEIEIPTAYDVLACIEKYDPENFESFCDNFGYDTDSRRAERTFHAVKEQWDEVEQLFNEEEIELLREIQ